MNISDRWLFIINPVAGNGYAATLQGRISNEASKRGISHETVMTAKPGDANKFASDYASRGFRYIVGVGGDGTFNEIASALTGKRDVTTGLIPAGTGNDFIQILGFPGRFEESDWERFFMAETTMMDTGRCNGKYFFNGMGLGFDAAVAAENYTEPGQVKRGGKSKYIWHILKTILFYRERTMITVTGGVKTTVECFMNTVSIGRRFAGAFFITPGAMADDGLLDICLVSRISVPRRLSILTMVPKGNHIKESCVKYYQTGSLSIEFGEKVPFHLDGELFFSDRFDIDILPKALNVIYNPSGSHFFRLT